MLEWKSWRPLVLGVLLLVPGCRSAPESLVALWASATPTATPIPTTTPTPSPTVTPSLTPTPTPLPPSLALVLEPESPVQGQTVVVRVSLDRAATLNADFDGQSLAFLYDSPLEAWALVGIPPWTEVGARQLVIEAVASDGQLTRVSHIVNVQPGAFVDQNIDVPNEQDFLLSAGLRPAEDEYLREILQEVSPEPLWKGPFGIPSEGIRSSPYGARRSYQGGPVVSYHGGLDFAAPQGTGVFAAADGIVVLAEPLYVRGNVVILDHGAGVHTLYFHLSRLDVARGQRVSRGDLLGFMGSTGLSTGSHLHWEVRIGDVFVDPDEWLARSFP